VENGDIYTGFLAVGQSTDFFSKMLVAVRQQLVYGICMVAELSCTRAAVTGAIPNRAAQSEHPPR
jgi:hypothetical protein